MESEGLVVSSALKFPVKRRTRKVAYEEWQTHGFEVDLVAARSDRLVLATVKSFFGSRGVVAEHVRGEGSDPRANALYALLNDPLIRGTVVAAAAERFGFQTDQIELRLYVGRFATSRSEEAVRDWCAEKHVGAGPIAVIGAERGRGDRPPSRSLDAVPGQRGPRDAKSAGCRRRAEVIRGTLLERARRLADFHRGVPVCV